MSLNSSFAGLGSSTNPSAQSELTFVTIIIAIVIAWILVALWTRVIENFAFGALRLDGNSAWHSLLVAVVVMVLLLAFVWVVDQYNLVPGGLETDIESIGGAPFNIPTSGLSEDGRNGVFIPSSA